MRPLQDLSGVVLFDNFASQTHLLRLLAEAPSAAQFPASFTEQDFIDFFGSDDGILTILINKKLVVPFAP